MDYDRKRDLLWVAGGPTGMVRAQDADTGKVVREYDFSDKSRFLNDLTVTRRAVLVTDSFNQELAVIPFHRKHGHDSSQHRNGLPPAGAGTVLDDHRLAPFARQPVGDDARHHIGGAAGRERHHDLDRARRVVVRLGRSGRGAEHRHR